MAHIIVGHFRSQSVWHFVSLWYDNAIIDQNMFDAEIQNLRK